MATATIPRGRTAEAASPWAQRFAWGVVGYNILVIVWGALVRATGSGAGCGNHWPLCNGQVIPLSPTTHTIIEFTHRQMTTGSVFLVIGLLVWTLRTMVKGQVARAMAIASTILLFNEAILGALLVKLGYVTDNRSVGRVILLSVHLSNTLLLLGALVLTAYFLSTGQRWSDLRTKYLGWSIAGLVATLVVGVSGSLAALGDTLFPADTLRAAMVQDFATTSPLLLRLRSVHPISAVLAGAFVLWLVARSRRRSIWVVSLLALQMALGLADILLLAPTWMQLAHLFGADLYWAALIVLAASVVWPVEESSGAAAR